MKPALLIVLSLVLVPFLAGCTNYGESVEFGKSSVYYKDGVTKEEAQKLGESLKALGYLSDEEARDVQLVKDGETYVVKFAAKEDAELTEEVIVAFGFLKARIAGEVFPGKDVKVQITDENLEPIKDI